MVSWEVAGLPAAFQKPEPEGSSVVKKLLVIVVLGLSAFALWRKVQADRAELDLWTEATTADD
jgi:hypothetical protein